MSSRSSTKQCPSYEMVNVDVEEIKKSMYVEGPLVKAARLGDLETLTLLLKKGEKVTVTGQGGGTPLHWAANNLNFSTAIECCQEIIRHVRNSPDKSLLSTVLNYEDKIQQTPIVWAIGTGNSQLVNFFLNSGSKLGTNFKNETLLHSAVQIEDSELAERCVEVLLDVKNYSDDPKKRVEYLNVERKWTNWTCLHMATIAGHSLVMELLIRSGADVNKVDRVGRNVFHRSSGHDAEISPQHTGFTALHSSANLENQYKAESCVKTILKMLEGNSTINELLNAQDQEGRTPLYLAAANRNIGATKALLLAGSAFDIRTKRGKTPLEKVYEMIPQAVNVLLEEAVKTSGFVEHLNSVNTQAELDFGPILGYSTTKSNVYKETEELAKVCYAKFEDRKAILHNTFIKIYIHEKWRKIRIFFILLFRILHVAWYLANFFILVSLYRVNCPYKDAKEFSWTSLRPLSEETKNHTSLKDCEITVGNFWCGVANLIALAIFIFSQFHVTKQRLHWIFRPMKTFKANTFLVERVLIRIGYHIGMIFRILPCWSIVLGTTILFSTLPVLGILVLDETLQYITAGVLGLLIWLSIYMELGKVPRFRVYINLLQRSTQTLLLAIAVTAPILIGFSTVFVVLMPGEPSFSSTAQSFVKIITFMIGELDYSGLFYGDGKENIFSGILMLALAVFIVIIVVLLVNFLIGLAAEEIRDFWERAEIWKLCTQLEQIVMLESFLDETVPICGKGFLRRNLMLMPPDRENEQIVKQWRRATINIAGLPQDLRKELHELNLKTIGQIR